MRILKHEAQSAHAAARALKAGALVALPTDTVYGFSGLVPHAVPDLICLKARGCTETEGNRREGYPFIALLADPQDVVVYTGTRLPAEFRALWPGPYTFVLRMQDGATQAFRCPADMWLRSVIRAVGGAIFSTSANRHGEPPLQDAQDIDHIFGKHLALTVDAGPLTGSPSAVIDLTHPVPRVLRAGAAPLPLAGLERRDSPSLPHVGEVCKE